MKLTSERLREIIQDEIKSLNEKNITDEIDDVISSLKKSHEFDDISMHSGFNDKPVIIGNTYDSITIRDINKILSKVNAKGDVTVSKQKSVQTKDGYWDVSIKNIKFNK
jgi:hypothetical protein